MKQAEIAAARPQHHAPELSAETRSAVLAVTARLKDQPGALLPILHGVQQALGHVPEAAIGVIAKELNLSRAEVHGVVSFYHFFRTQPGGRQVLYLCRADAYDGSCSDVAVLAILRHESDVDVLVDGWRERRTDPDGLSWLARRTGLPAA